MNGFGDSEDSAQRQLVLDAAVAELATKKVDAFTLEGVAARAGLDARQVRSMWPNTPELYSATIMEFAKRYITIPDTGTLRGDLLEYSTAYATAFNSPTGRRLIDAVLVTPKDWDVAGSREAFLDYRHNRVSQIVKRGIERGECAPDTDPGRFMDLLGGCLNMSVLYYDRPISDDDCRSVVDLLLYGIARQA